MSKAWKRGSTRRWRKTRESVLDDNLIHNAGRCTLQVPGVCTGTANTVHHTLGRSITGDDRRYLQATCKACNLHIGDPHKHDPAPRPITRW